MLLYRMALGGLVAASLTPASARAQQASNHAIIFSGRGGGYNALTNLNDAGTTDTKLGFNAGGGVAVQVHRYVVIRGDFTYGRDELRTGGTDTGKHLNKFLYTGAIQLQYPTASGLTPYVLAGGGGITVHEEDTSGLDKTKAAGVGGLGLSYRIPHTRWAVFAEGLGYLYKVRDFRGSLAGFDKTQFDLAWSGGISYAVGF
jgi:opacity protein-like surface antigen